MSLMIFICTKRLGNCATNYPKIVILYYLCDRALANEIYTEKNKSTAIAIAVE